ncbi:MAG: SH3 domain-containing protein [Alphaproteobacteria bacterium]|nr:SH3 domain-containing protein [Alphaproteobacteria bacterium]
MTDKEKFLDTAWKYLSCNGDYVCNKKLHLGYITHWCAYAVSAIMKDCGFIGKYIKEVEGGAGSIPRKSDGKYGKWFKKSVNMPPQRGDLFFLRYDDYPEHDKYFCDHVGIVEEVNGNILTTLEGNVDAINGNKWAETSIFKRKYRKLYDENNDVVYAFYRPNWKTEVKTTNTSAKKDVEIYQLNSSKEVDYFVRVTASDGLNIRQGAGVKFNKLGAVPFNEVVKVTRQTSGGAYKWGLVEYDGVKGWIALNFTKKTSIEQLARDVIKGKYGNGAERKEILGTLYDEVQAKVNEILS